MSADAWWQLSRLGVHLRPLSPPMPTGPGRYSPFSAQFSATVRLLAKELRALGAKQIVLELDYQEQDLRLDGLPRANARMGSQGVTLSFDSKFGPLRYSTGEYGDWQDNLRDIALSMESLRAVDRYGVSKRGEQYRGWRALTRSDDPADQIITPEDARAFLDEHGGSFAEAAKRLHPDRGGDEGKFRAAVKARELLGAS